MITRQRQTTSETRMPPLAESLSDLRSACTCLTCALGIHLNKHPPSFFRFVRDEVQELPPASIVNRLSKTTSCHAFDVQFLRCNQPVVVDELARNPMVEVGTLLADQSRRRSEQSYGLSPSLGAFLSPCNTPLGDPQGRLRLSVIARVVNGLPIAQSGERRQADIDANHVGVKGQRHGFNFTSKQGEPVSALALDCESLDCSVNRSIQLNSHVADFGQSQPVTCQRLSNLPKGNAVVSSERSETWVSRFLPSFHPAKERLECFVYAGNHVLKNSGVDVRYVATILPDFRQLINLIKSAYRLAFQLPRFASFLQSRIEQLTANSKLICERLRLSFRRVNPKPEGLNHETIIATKESAWTN